MVAAQHVVTYKGASCLIGGLTWQFPCQTRRWVWQPGGCTGFCGCRFSQWRQRSWATFLSLPQRASSHIVQLKEKKKASQLASSAQRHTDHWVYEMRHESPLTVLLHAQGDAALQPAVLAAVSVQLVDGALAGSPARVHQVLPDAALEETLAAFTADGPIVTPWGKQEARVRLCLSEKKKNCYRWLNCSFLPEALSPHTTQYSTTGFTIHWSDPSVTNWGKRTNEIDKCVLTTSNCGVSFTIWHQEFVRSPHLYLLPCQIRGGKQQLVDARAVWRGEYDFVGRTFLLGQDHLPASGIVSIGQDELLLSRGGWLQRCDNLDLLASLLIRYNLLYKTMRRHGVKECKLCKRLRP